MDDLRDTLSYKGHKFRISRKLRIYHVYHTGYDLTPADMSLYVLNLSKEMGISQEEIMNSYELLSDAAEKYMRAKVRVYKQKFDWDESEAAPLSAGDERKIEEYIKEHSEW